MTEDGFIPWDTFVKDMRWRQGEHVSIIGPTGAGKTHLARAILPMRDYSVVFATKPKDPAVKEFKSDGMKVIPEWGARHDAMHKIVLKPEFKRMEDQHTQRAVISEAMGSIFTQGGWCTFFDELRYITSDLGLDRMMKVMYLQGRSSKISIMAATQRPVWVPREMFSEATHFFMWRMSDKRDLKSLRDISGAVDPAEIERRLVGLPAVGSNDVAYHDVLYVNARSGRIAHTRAPK